MDTGADQRLVPPRVRHDHEGFPGREIPVGINPFPAEAMWRAADLTRAYLTQNRARVRHAPPMWTPTGWSAALAWLALDHDALFDDLGEPSMAVRHLDAVAALARPLPAEGLLRHVRQRAAGVRVGI
ncbi:hypothetical protein [Streptomyces smyrnaeus]|uniref:hypothetical protein n=1 Tax=Streptomyces smyrnaeus TaxID=1387713 RepID=UPI0033D7BC69